MTVITQDDGLSTTKAWLQADRVLLKDQEAIMWRETWLQIFLLLCAIAACARPPASPTVSPPPTVTIVLPDGTVIPGPARLDSPEKAQELVSFPVLVPDQETLPAGLELGFVAWKPYPEQGTEIVMFAYRGDGIDVDIQQLAPSRGRMAPPRQPHERIKVRGTTGYLLSSENGEAHGLSWEESGTMVNVSTSGLTRKQTLRIVEGMEPVRE